jgi:hypothetical protein
MERIGMIVRLIGMRRCMERSGTAVGWRGRWSTFLSGGVVLVV